MKDAIVALRMTTGATSLMSYGGALGIGPGKWINGDADRNDNSFLFRLQSDSVCKQDCDYKL